MPASSLFAASGRQRPSLMEHSIELTVLTVTRDLDVRPRAKLPRAARGRAARAHMLRAHRMAMAPHRCPVSGRRTDYGLLYVPRT